MPASVAYPLIDGMTTDVVVTDDRIRELVSVELTPTETVIARTLESTE